MKAGRSFFKEANAKRLCFLILLSIELLVLAFMTYGSLQKEKEYRYLIGDDVPNIERTISLKRGVYMVDLTYETGGTDGSVQMHMTSSLSEDVGDIVTLSKMENQKTFEYILYEDADRVWLTSESEDGNLVISSITIRGTRQLEKAKLFLLCCFFVTIDLFYLFLGKWCHPYSREEKCTALTLTGICILASIPLFVNYVILGHDLTFHLMRIEGLAQGILDGQFPVRIQPGWLNDYGYPVSVMYGDLLLYIPAFLRIMGLPLQSVYKIYVFAVNILTVLVSYYCAKEVFHNKKAGLLGALLYTLAGYRIVNLYYRCAVGEFTAMAFLPLIFLAFWRLFHEEESSKKKTALLMIVGFTGILQAHTLSMEMTVLFVLIFCILNISKFWKNLRFLVLTAIVTIGVNLSFLVPMIDYMTSVDMRVMYTDSYMQSHSIFPAQIFQTFAFGGNCSSMTIEGISGDMPLGAGLLMVFVVALFLWETILYREQIKEKVGAGEWGGQCRIFGVLVLAILMSCYFFPWSAIRKLPVIGRMLTPYQFAWRFLEMAVAFTAILGCFVVKNLYIIYDRTIRIGLIFLLCTTAVVSAQVLVDHQLAEGTPQKITSGAFVDSVYAVSGGEYVPMETPLELLYNTAVQSEDGVMVEESYRYKKYYYVSCINGTALERKITVPVIAYKGYVAVDDATGEKLTVTYNENRILQVVLPAGYQGNVKVYFKEPFYWRIAEMISLVLLIGIVLWGFQRNSFSEKTANGKKQEKIA